MVQADFESLKAPAPSTFSARHHHPISVMPIRKSRRSTRKPKDTPKKPPVDSPADFQLIIQDNLIKFMGRRFPEFCILRAACRVSVKASSSTTGDARVASYQAAIDSVAARYYVDWPFMVEVLNKWLEMNRDFVRDPLGYAAPESLPIPPSTTISTIRDAPDSPLTLALTSDRAPTQIASMVAGSPSLSLPTEAGAPEYIADSSLVASASGMKPNGLDDPPSSTDGRDVRVPIRKFLPLTWTISFRFLPSFWNFVVGTFSSVVAPSLFRLKQKQGQY